MAPRHGGRRALRALALAVGVAWALALVKAGVESFVPAPRNAPTSAPAGFPASAEAQGAGAAVTLGLAALAAAPEPAVAMGPEMLVVGPLGIINTGLNAYKFALGIYALLSWLFAFGILDNGNEIVGKIQGFLASIIDPVLAPLRSIIPSLAGFDISFMVLWFVIEQAQSAAAAIIFGAMTYGAADTVYYTSAR